MPLNVLSLDPGVTTGYCAGCLDSNTFFLAPGQEQLGHREIYKLLTAWSPDHVVCEDFEFRPGIYSQQDALVLTSLEYIGVVELWCDPGVKLYRQKAAEGKGYFSNEKLKQLGVYKQNLAHGMDALRHLLHWFVFKEGYKYNNEPRLQLVEPRWLHESYSDPLSHYYKD